MKKNKKVLLGMSGGVDSSVAALLLKNQGYSVMGAFMKNFSDSKSKLTGECNWREERRMAKKTALILNIPLITLDFEKQYRKQVIDPMFKAYRKGVTPNPDIACNTVIKFPLLWKEAKKLKVDYIATGHYVRIKKTSKGFQLLQGKDKTKDQSYFLSELTQKDLSHTLFPIGNLRKSQVREIAKKHKFPNHDKKGTRGICFVGKIDMRSFLEQRIKNKKGKVLNPEREEIGSHPGTSYFTIGQRVGPRLGLKINKHLEGKWYIAEKKKPNTLIIAPEKHPILKKREIGIKSLHLINPKEKIPKELKARIRNLGPLHKGNLTKSKKNCKFKLNRPIEQVAEGQFIALYNKNQLVASGEISC